jgi:glycosyltransferase involved in cell wall biosynthesis
MIKVLNIISDTNIGGAGRVLINYLQYADSKTFETAVAVPAGSLLVQPLRDLGAAGYEVDGMVDRSYHKDDVKTLMELIRKVGPDIVHTHGALSGRIAARRCGKTVIFTRHSAFPVSAKLRYPPGRWVNKLLNEYYSDHIIAVSPAAAENLTDAGVSPKRITTMMNGVAPVERRGAEACAAAKAEWGVSEDEFVFGILARIEPYKGHLDIVKAAEQLAKDGRRFKLLIAGIGNYEQELRQEVEKRKLEEYVRFLGFQTDVAKFLSILDVQLNASYGTETSSLSILEGFSMNVPAIVSDYGGNPWLVDDGENGLMFPTRDDSALYRCIAKVMDEPETLRNMSRRAGEIFEERFTGRIFAQNIENVYRKTLKGAHHGTK